MILRMTCIHAHQKVLLRLGAAAVLAPRKTLPSYLLVLVYLSRSAFQESESAREVRM